MANDIVTPLGPLFGPNSVLITVNDETGVPFSLQVYPDANNDLLKANGSQMHFYFQPKVVYLAKKQSAPADFDFGMTVFKGLMTEETTLGVGATTGGDAEAGGGFCTFATTFAIPENVIAKAIQALKNQQYGTPLPPLVAHLFGIENNDPDPSLGLVQILENNVTIEVPPLPSVGNANVPFFINAQGNGKGSIEASGISAFLVTCNQNAAGAIVGSLKGGVSPFTVHYNLKESFYINACDVHIIANVDKIFDQFSAAVSAGGFLGIDSATLSANYQSCVTSGAIQTIMTMNGAAIPNDLKQMIENQTEEMRKAAFDLVKHEIFDWTPTPDPPATTDRSFFSSLFGGASVSLKANYQRHNVNMTYDLTLNTTLAVYDTPSGTLNELEPAIKADLNKYLAIVDIGEYFKKVQVAATNNLNWSEKLSDGTDLADPVTSAQVEVAYPDYSTPLDANNQPNLRTQASGFHYTTGQNDQSRPESLAVWTADNPHDIINIAFLRLDNPIAAWDQDQVKIRKTIVFNGSDPRVELDDGGTTFVKEIVTKGHAPVITRDEIGYIFVRFMLDIVLPKDNITLTLTCSLGSRKDTITITKANQKNIIWEIFSDKYLDATSFQYDLQVEIAGPNFTDTPVVYQNPQSTVVALPTGRIKYINPFKLRLPTPPEDQLVTINNYVKNYPS